jgi:hypothetical protein
MEFGRVDGQLHDIQLRARSRRGFDHLGDATPAVFVIRKPADGVALRHP